MKRRLSVSAGLLLLCALTLPGAASVEAAGIGVQFGGHGHNIPRAIAGGHNPHVDAATGAVANESEHEKYSTEYDGRKYGDQVAQMSARRGSRSQGRM